MKVMEKRLKYYELLMTYQDTSKYLEYNLPEGYHISFYQEGDEYEWSKIHVYSGEFTSIEKGLKHFHDFFDYFKDELSKRCFFIETDNGEKIATATISLLEEKEGIYEAAVDWVAIKEAYQGKKLAKPLISYLIKLAHELGHNKLILHTQTHTWLAAKLYLDFGFEPYQINESLYGWRILKTITNHEKLKEIEPLLEEEMYSKTAIKIVDELNKIHGEKYVYQIWHKNGRHDVAVFDYKDYFEYQYYLENDKIRLEKVNLE